MDEWMVEKKVAWLDELKVEMMVGRSGMRLVACWVYR
jgi:hypothetical protein